MTSHFLPTPNASPPEPASTMPSRLSTGQMGEWEWDIGSGKAIWSPVMESLCGLPAGSFGGTYADALTALHPEDHAGFEAAAEKSLREQCVLHLFCRVVHPGGAVRWLACMGNVVRSLEGNITGLMGVCLDITAQKEAEEEIKAREQRLQTIADNVPVLIARVDTDRRYVFANRAYNDMIGIPAEQVVGRTIPEVLGAAAYATVSEYVDRALAGERVVYEARLDYATVGPRIMHGSYLPERGPSGEVTGFLLSAMDVTAIRQTEEEKMRLALIVEHSHDAIIGTALDGTITSWNQGAERLYGYTAEEAAGQSIGLVYPPEERGEIALRINAMADTRAALAYEAFRVRKDGTRRWMFLSVFPVRDAAGKITGHASIARDITAQKEAENALRQLAQLVESSHDAIVGTSLDGKILSWNRGAERLYGYTAQEAVGQSTRMLHPPEEQGKTAERLAFLQMGEDIVQYEEVRVRKNRERRIVSITISPVRSSAGEMVSHSAISRDITAQKEAEETMRRLALIVEHSHDAIIGTALDGTITSWNQGAERLYGYTAQEAVGRSIATIHPSEDLPLMQERLARLRRGEEIPQYEAVRVRKNGERRIVSVTISPVRGSSGQVTGHATISRDITAQKEAEETMRRLSRIVEHSHDSIIGADNDGTILSWNRGAERLYGYSAAEALSGSVKMLFLPEDRAQFEARMVQLQDGREIPPYEAVRLHKDGTTRQVSVTVSPILDPEGRVVSHAAISRDITAQKEAEETMRRLSLIVEHSHDAIIGTDSDGIIQSWNNGAARMYDYTAAEMVGQSVERLYPPEEMPVLSARLAALRRGEEIAEFEAVHFGKDGRPRSVAVTVSPVRDSSGQVTGNAAISRDIRERKALEAERERLLAEANDRADRDPLTGLLNHRAFHKRLEEETERCTREGTFLAVAMLDLNNFKFFNDAYGHQVGDDALRRVAEALRQGSRSYDTLARFGGDEFAVLMPGREDAETAAVAASLAERLKGIALTPPGSLTEVPLTLTMGAALFPDEGLSRHEVIALADTRLYEAKSGVKSVPETEPHRQRFRRSVDGFAMLDTLVSAVDTKDRSTRRHCDSVLQTALAFAAVLGLDEDARESLAQAALLQEIGKVGVPDRILRKPGPLTEEECAAVQQHASLGGILIDSTLGRLEVSDTVRYHHEHWNGGGYPLGLRGEEIPRLARILAVADAYCAMTSDRPYRKAMTDEAAREILRLGAGQQWDPDCVEVFLRG